MRAPALPAKDRMLTLVELGAMLHSSGGRLRERIAASPTLRAGRRYVGRHAQFIESYVVRYMHVEMAAAPTASVPS